MKLILDIIGNGLFDLGINEHPAKDRSHDKDGAVSDDNFKPETLSAEKACQNISLAFESVQMNPFSWSTYRMTTKK
nr:hypothetical protein [Desulfobacula sp.]